jgi:hypothetical protein
MKIRALAILIPIMFFGVIVVGSVFGQEIIKTPEPTYTLYPTYTPLPIQTPLPTSTNYPTNTPYPTYTQIPTPTKILIANTPGPPAYRDIPGFDQQIMIKIDEQINCIQNQIEIIQSDRLANNAPLLQLPSTHENPVDIDTNPNGIKPDLRRRIGIDSWFSSAFVLPAGMMVSIRIDVYEGPSGVGYVIVSEVIHHGGIWTRKINIGAEKWRDQDWIMLIS